MGQLSPACGKQTDLYQSGQRDLLGTVAVGKTPSPQQIPTMDKRCVIPPNRRAELGRSRRTDRQERATVQGPTVLRIPAGDRTSHEDQRRSQPIRPGMGSLL